MLLWVNFEAFWREKRLKYERQIGFEIKPYVMLLYNVNTLILCVCVFLCSLSNLRRTVFLESSENLPPRGGCSFALASREE
jgi:hypothetical protein